jgi:aryl-alcohol dehydrogenase-like predicted oxidoreductase
MAAWEFQTLQNIAEKHGWHKFVSMQNYYNLLYREEGKGESCYPPRSEVLLCEPELTPNTLQNAK